MRLERVCVRSTTRGSPHDRFTIDSRWVHYRFFNVFCHRRHSNLFPCSKVLYYNTGSTVWVKSIYSGNGKSHLLLCIGSIRKRCTLHHHPPSTAIISIIPTWWVSVYLRVMNKQTVSSPILQVSPRWGHCRIHWCTEFAGNRCLYARVEMERKPAWISFEYSTKFLGHNSTVDMVCWLNGPFQRIQQRGMMGWLPILLWMADHFGVLLDQELLQFVTRTANVRPFSVTTNYSKDESFYVASVWGLSTSISYDVEMNDVPILMNICKLHHPSVYPPMCRSCRGKEYLNELYVETPHACWSWMDRLLRSCLISTRYLSYHTMCLQYQLGLYKYSVLGIANKVGVMFFIILVICVPLSYYLAQIVLLKIIIDVLLPLAYTRIPSHPVEQNKIE